MIKTDFAGSMESLHKHRSGAVQQSSFFATSSMMSLSVSGP